jgi:hypothetical protein
VVLFIELEGNMVSTMKISEETKRALLKIAAEHTIKGKERSLEDCC